MNILILGGTGFLSGAMLRDALAANHQVFALTRGKRPPSNPAASFLAADRNDPAAFAAALAPLPTLDLVIDCIGFNADHARQDLSTFFPPDAFPRTRHLVFISSDFACSPIDRPWIIDESFDRFSTAPYGAGKRAAEEVLLHASAHAQLPITILRPGHIYGPGSQLGCLPKHARDPDLLAKIQRGDPLHLVSDGQFLQQPIFVDDLVTIALACPANPSTRGQLYFAPGAEITTSRRYYQLIGELLGTPAVIHELSTTDYLREKPEHRAFCCHRVYDTAKARSHHLPLASTSLKIGLHQHIQSLLPR